MTRSRARGFALPLLLAVAACGDDPTDIIEGDTLTQAEAEALAEVLAGTLFATWEQSGALAAPARVTGTATVNDTFPCEFGGSVAVSGTLALDIDDETEDGSLTFDVTQEHNDCMAQSEDDILFTLNGAPNITSHFVIALEGNALTFDGGYDGAVSFETEEKSGTCSLDVDFGLAGDVSTGTGSATLTGRVCGITFSHSLVLS